MICVDNDKKRAAKKAKEEKERVKMEAAEELGLIEKVRERGWRGLTSKESGSIGGKISAGIRKKRREK